jgi:hypothetical protein
MKLRTLIATAATAAVLATSGVAIAGASSGSTPAPSPAPAASPAASPAVAPVRRAAKVGEHAKARRLRIAKLLRGAGDVVTKAIGIDRATLRRDLGAGQTIAEIATANHVAPQAVIDALVAAAKTKLDAAVSAGKIPAALATRIEARLPTRVAKLVNNWHPKHLRKAAAS